MKKIYVVMRKTPFFTEVYKVCETMSKAECCVRNSVYSAREFTIVESELYE